MTNLFANYLQIIRELFANRELFAEHCHLSNYFCKSQLLRGSSWKMWHIQIYIYTQTSIGPKYGAFYLKNEVSDPLQSLLVLLSWLVTPPSKALTGNHLTEAMDNVDDEEGAPAEKEDAHDDADRDGGLVLLHQTMGDLTRGSLVVNSQLCRYKWNTIQRYFSLYLN